jgi:hypothetical protein
MNENIFLPIFTGILGLVAGLLIPFVKWHIEKLKMRRLDRISFINQLREIISSAEFDVYKFKDTSLYSRFRKYLPINIVERIENKDGIIRVQLIIAGSRGGLNNELLDFITILEGKWNLI